MYFYMVFVQIKQLVKWHIGGTEKWILFSLESSREHIFHVKLNSCWVYGHISVLQKVH